TSGLWPVYKGASFNLWEPDTGTYYAWADPEHITSYLQQKRLNQARHRRSAFSLMSGEWIAEPTTLPCQRARIAFRDVTNRTNSRTVIVGLVPPSVLLNHTCPYLLFSRGDM